MLLELTVTNFAIIDHLRLSFGPSLNVFTGETGAGKSIIVDAISALVGERTGSDVVRSGCDRAVIEGIFDVSALLPTAGASMRATAHANPPGGEHDEESESQTIAELLTLLDIEPEDGTLILTREILASGRSIARLNRRTVPLSSLQHLARFLVDIHGQSAHLALLRPAQHIFYLDRYAGTEELQQQVAGLVTQWRGTRRELERLRSDEREIARRIELLQYQVDEIEAARLRSGELEELETERRRLANAERLGELSMAVYAGLSGDPGGDAPGALDLAATAQRALAELLRLDDSLREQESTIEQALSLLQDVAWAIHAYQDEIAADPDRQAEVEERLDLISRLRRKYGATIEEILAYAETAGAELDELTHREERASMLETTELELRTHIGALAAQLSKRRQVAGERLAAAMERELNDLNMRRARFQIRIAQLYDADGVPADLDDSSNQHGGGPAPDIVTYAFSATGIDQVEFLIAPNPGEPFKPLARIASGGETSRLMLALKTILSQADPVPILIFDEIDSGISGRSGQTVGEKLWQLGRTHQVLCVTHLPQIAAQGDCHYRVAKALSGERTVTQVDMLETDDRVIELSQMLGGASTEAARANARELLDHARKRKQAIADTGKLA